LIKIKALTTFVRRCKTTNRIPDIRLIGAREVNSYIDYFDNWNKSPQKIEGIVSSEDIKFDINKFVGFREKIETLTSSVYGHRGITIEYLLRAPSSNDRDGPIEEPTPDIYSGEFMAANAAFNGAELMRLKIANEELLAAAAESGSKTERRIREAVAASAASFEAELLFEKDLRETAKKSNEDLQHKIDEMEKRIANDVQKPEETETVIEVQKRNKEVK